jgi:hypothetical protein
MQETFNPCHLACKPGLLSMKKLLTPARQREIYNCPNHTKCPTPSKLPEKKLILFCYFDRWNVSAVSHLYRIPPSSLARRYSISYAVSISIGQLPILQPLSETKQLKSTSGVHYLVCKLSPGWYPSLWQCNNTARQYIHAGDSFVNTCTIGT